MRISIINLYVFNLLLGGYTSEPEVTSYSVFAGKGNKQDGDYG